MKTRENERHLLMGGGAWHRLSAALGYYAPSLPPILGGSAVADALPGTDLGAAGLASLGRRLQAYLALTKPRIIVLLVITGYAAMWVAAKGAPPAGLTLVTLLGLAMSCGAANAINMWWDQDIDAVMSRTKKRPIPAGILTGEQALSFGIGMGALAFVLLAVAVNLLTAVLALCGLLYYVLIYTMWLKRSSVHNIVIGGAAGAIPPLVGWAAVTNSLGWTPWLMFLIVFMWTPPHFWALALYRNEDYRRAGVPMLPVVKGEMHTKWQILGYAALNIPVAVSLYWTGTMTRLYLFGSLGLSLGLVGASLLLLRERLPDERWARRTFLYSLLYLALIFVAMVVGVRG